MYLMILWRFLSGLVLITLCWALSSVSSWLVGHLVAWCSSMASLKCLAADSLSPRAGGVTEPKSLILQQATLVCSHGRDF